jgi:hypothetical protein
MRWAAVVLLGCANGAIDAAPADAHVDAVEDTSVVDTTDAAVCDPRDPPPFDLDADGVPETQLAIAACGAATCLTAVSPLAIKKEINLGGPESCGTLAGPRIRAIGSHVGTPLHEVSVMHCAGGRVSLDVIDLAAGTIAASARAPAARKSAWGDALRDPKGLYHPFLAPSYGDAAPPDPTYGVGSTWGYGCVFDPARTADVARCGAGFASFDLNAAVTFFREVGGYTIDLNGDGWEDPTFVFHQRVVSISGATGTLLANLEYDVAATTEPASPKWFHSGRNYGSFSASNTGGVVRVAQIGATPVGTFTDYNCNVSRYLAVRSGGTIAWSRYIGFASTIFSRYEQAYAADPSSVIARKGDFVDRCMHRFSDGRTTIDGTPALVYSIFHAKSWSTCLVEQYALYIGDPADPNPDKRPWSAPKQKAWGDCQVANLKARGSWAMEAAAEATGAGITGSTGTYVWGWTDKLTKSGERLYLVEMLPAEHTFDLSDAPATKLRVYALVKGLWTDRGTFPIAGRPKLAMVEASGARGMGAYSAFAELSLRDVDCDGLADVELADGRHVGVGGDGFVIKTR